MTAYNPNPQGPVAKAFDKNKAILLLVLSVLCGTNIFGIIFSALALSKGDQDPVEAAKYMKWGWIAFFVVLALWILLIIVYIIFIAIAVSQGDVTTTTTTY